MADQMPVPEEAPPRHTSSILRRQWPPDMSKMSESDRYRMERKYKRRVRIRGQHPASWMRFTGVLQLLTVTVLPAYMVLIMDWPMAHPFGPLREWMWKKVDYISGSRWGTHMARGSTTASNPAVMRNDPPQPSPSR